ncbi:MAG: AAA family ATPase, partial [Desulfovibrio sp.]|nr:AAA family ATPase [Desulfovibrio sp.]
MRILHIRLKNLNSLVGEWFLDLTHPAFGSDGIFTISGPTGSGKTSLLDALSLALYGQTPRLGKITKASNELMSRQTGECFAEVRFATESGEYLCHFSQHRSRKKPDGELQNPHHELARADGSILESSLKGVPLAVARICGMHFEQFTRSMLLAQGGFAAFLKASADERTPLLEQLTGTEIYTAISVRVHERKRLEREKLALLEAESAGIRLLTAEDVALKKEALQKEESQEKQLKETLGSLRNAIVWRKGLDALAREQTELLALQAKLEARTRDFADKARVLTLGRQAESLRGLWLGLCRQRKSLEQARLSHGQKMASLPMLEAEAGLLTSTCQTRLAALEKAKKELADAMPLLNEVRALDLTIAALEKDEAEEAEAVKREQAKVTALEKELVSTQAQISRQEQSLQERSDFLAKNDKDSELERELKALEARALELAKLEKKERESQLFCQKAEKALKEAKDEHQRKSKALANAQKLEAETISQAELLQQSLRNLLGELLLPAYRRQKDELLRQLTGLRTIQSLDKHRAQLEDGKACPLCGSCEHPYAQGNVPRPDATEKAIQQVEKTIKEAESLEAKLSLLEKERVRLREQKAQNENSELTARCALEARQKELESAREAQSACQAESLAAQKALDAELAPFGLNPDPRGYQAKLDLLAKRSQSYQKAQKEKTELAKGLAESQAKQDKEQALLATLRNGLRDFQAEQARLHGECEQQKKARVELFGKKKVEQEERLLQSAQFAAEEALEAARKSEQKAVQSLTALRAELETLASSIAQSEQELLGLEAEFSQKLGDLGIGDEAAFKDALLSPERLSALEKEEKELARRSIELAASYEDCQKRRALEEAKALTEKGVEELLCEEAEADKSLRELQELAGRLKHELLENTRAQARMAEKEAVLAGQKKECLRWDMLHELIGSADGKRFRNYAQGLSFEVMVRYANKQLQKMTDRYLLVRDEKEPLELNVIDSYQADSVRSTKNLSGGESFLVSLALALGLAKMSSSNVRVDSLFLDEGFGTLDDEA